MVTVGMNYKVIPGKEEVFERAFKSVLDVMGKSPGHSQSHLYTEVGQKGTYLIISDWNDKTAFDAFVKSDAFAKVVTWGKEQILADRPKHQIFQPEL
jgi:heme-degrading monooxygenase HmoA